MVGCDENSVSVPEWVQILVSEKFFEPCVVHCDARKNEKNVFCLDCSKSICSHCLNTHQIQHRLLQVRRYVYHDVVRFGDAQKLMNCSYVQTYTTNSAKVVFLKQRPMGRPFRGSGSFCQTCDRSLQASFLFCSLSCKFQQQFNQLDDNDDEDDDRVTPETVLEAPSWGSTTTSEGTALVCTAATRRKRNTVTVPRSCYRPVVSPVTDCSGRRKSVPRRSPLY